MPIRLSPFSKLLPYLIFGILIGHYVQIDQKVIWPLLLAGIGLASFFHLRFYEYVRTQRVFGFQMGVLLVFSSIGVLLGNNSHENRWEMNQSYSQKTIVKAKVKDIHISDSSTIINVVLLNGYLGDTLINCPIGAIVKDKKSEFIDLLPDDEIYVEGRAQMFFSNTNPGAFNYRKYMKENGNFFQINARSLSLVHRPIWSIRRLVYQIRSYLSLVLKKHLEKRELGVAEALILGQKQYLENETKQAFAGVGAMHILAVSGLHVGLVFLLFSWLFKPLISLPNGNVIQTILVIVVIVVYAAITGFSPSVTRASLMFILISLGVMLRRVGDTYNTIFASAFLMLMYKPSLLFNIGFQLSYVAVIGIIYLYPKLFNCFRPMYWLSSKIWSLFCLAIAAQLATFPLGLFYFHQFPTYFFVTNLVVIPAAFIVLFGGFTLFFSNFFTRFDLPVIENSLGWIFQKLVWLLNEFIELLYSFPYSSITQIEISFIQLVLIYFGILSVLIFFIYKNGSFLKVSLAMLLLLGISHSWKRYHVLNSSGVLVYQYNSPVVEVFEGENSSCYLGFIDPQKQFYFDRMVQDFNRNEGRRTDTLIKMKNLKRKKVEVMTFEPGNNEIKLLEKKLTFKFKSATAIQDFNLDSARMFLVVN